MKSPDLFIIIGAVVLLALLVLLIVYSWTLVRQSQAIVVERLGKFHRVLKQGIHFIIPLIDRAVCVKTEHGVNWESNTDWIDDMQVVRYGAGEWSRISLKERVADFPPQAVITKDNAVVKINTVVFFQVMDPKQFVYGAEDPIYAIKLLTETTVRNSVGELELDEVLASRDLINQKLCYTLDEAADAWGIKILRVEVQEINPPEDIQEAMHKQMKAERERRAVIISAEGNKVAEILKAESAKESEILRAEGNKMGQILKAEGKAQAISLINASRPSREYLTLEGYKAVKDMADGQATKIVVPSEIQNISGLLAGLKAVVSDDTGACNKEPVVEELKVEAEEVTVEAEEVKVEVEPEEVAVEIEEPVIEEKVLTRFEILSAMREEDLTEDEWFELELEREAREKAAKALSESSYFNN